MDISLLNKQAFVCGSTQGIGKAVAFELASLGANVTLCARNEEKLKELSVLLDTSQGQKHDCLVADFFNPDLLKAKIQDYVSDGRKVNILVNNTGGPPAGDAIDAKPEEFLKAFSAHLICNQHLVQTFVDGMKEDAYGRVINIISTSVKVPIPGLGVSNTTRGAVASWAKTLARELAPFGITVNNVLPGFTKTARLDGLISVRAEKNNKTFDEYEKIMMETVPAKRFATSEEVAGAVAYLASPVAAYVNGINLPVDGGNTPSL
ncbi:SDR family oxidoreductase [Chondrinema litorale]|uniref:SDR family oxidoreductase n=1 Tax=Chondrinema litorale TaxID=2994555 RepID=UPI002543FB1F|nr:SDR family oxidoreductase [Chondrinema litorale]UZR93330.1 SDR family oxidoreductase [Chondrinema litorale]